MTTTRFHIASTAEPGATLCLREATAIGRPGHAGRALLFVHGATYPGAMFDVPGASWMARAVADGYDAYALDVRGYGGSTRPESMAAPPEAGEPFCRAEDAAADIADAITEIRRRAGVARVDVVAWSWGTMTTACHVAAGDAAVGRLVLFAPVYGTNNPGWVDWLSEPGQPNRLRAARRLSDRVARPGRCALVGSDHGGPGRCLARPGGSVGLVRRHAGRRAGRRSACAQRRDARSVVGVQRAPALRRRAYSGTHARHPWRGRYHGHPRRWPCAAGCAGFERESLRRDRPCQPFRAARTSAPMCCSIRWQRFSTGGPSSRCLPDARAGAARAGPSCARRARVECDFILRASRSERAG